MASHVAPGSFHTQFDRERNDEYHCREHRQGR